MGKVVIISSALYLTACEAKTTSTLPPPHVGLRLTTPEVARRSSGHGQHVDLPFRLLDRGVNGTALLIAFLQRVESHGGIYASEVSYALQMTHGGKNIECVSKIVVDDGHRRDPVEPAPDAADALDGDIEYTTTVKPWTPRASDAWVVDRTMVCKQHAQQVAAKVPQYENRYNAEVGRYITPKQIPTDSTTIVHYDECRFEPTRRFVHRYEHFVASRFSPPDLDVLQRQYADGQLIQAPPMCHELELAPGQALRQHIEADIRFATTVEQVHENEYELQEPVPSQGADG